MFIIGHYIRYCNYRDLVWVLYSYLNLNHLLPFKMDVGAFYAEVHWWDTYHFLEFVIPHHVSCGVSSPEMEFLRDLVVDEDHLV